MKRMISIFVALFMASFVNAADLGGMKGGASSYQDVSAPVGSWTGVYFGAHAGYGWNSNDLKMTEHEVTPGTDESGASLAATETIKSTLLAIDPDGIFGGIHAGADYQVPNGRLVFGVFGDFNFADSEQSDSFGVKINDGNSYLIAGRVGALINDKTLLYALAGYGWQDVTYSGDGESIDKTFGHVVAGGGLEYKFTKELSFSLEGQHWFESDEKIVSTVDTDGSFEATDARSDTRVLARVNYRFGGN